jgi:large subunit ribosomal protein L17
MRHSVAGRGLGRATDHRKSLYRNLVTDLLDYGKIRTTEAKAKEIQAMAEKMITLAKDGTLAARRKALASLFDESVVTKLFDDIAGKFAGRAGGYTRITKMGPRLGDGASMAQIELVEK